MINAYLEGNLNGAQWLVSALAAVAAAAILWTVGIVLGAVNRNRAERSRRNVRGGL